jgi:hypothetical protein
VTESERLMTVAAAVAAGDPVDWSEKLHAPPSAPDDTATLATLYEIESIIKACRAVDAAPEDPEGSSRTPRIWKHLIVLDKVGEGSFGTVYRAYDPRLQIDVALKLLSLPRVAHGPSDRFLVEAQLLARVRHPNVVTVHGVDETPDQLGIWMEFVKGKTLEDLVRTQGAFDVPTAAAIGRDLCGAVAAVHQADVVHGDIKLSNIMRQDDGRIVLMDFGATQAPRRKQDVAGRLAGTPAYLAPEVLTEGRHSEASDQYAIGVVLYRLVSGTYPRSDADMRERTQSRARAVTRTLRDVRRDVPDAFARIVARAMAEEPSQRYPDVRSLESALASTPQAIDSRRGLRTWIVAGAVVTSLVAIAAWWVGVTGERGTRGAPTAAVVRGAAHVASSAYDIDAALYRLTAAGEQRLGDGSRLSPGDELFLRFRASVPVTLYVVNEDDAGQAYLLYPLPGAPRRTVPAGELVTLPGDRRWQVTSAGGREHFLFFASPSPIDSLEQAFGALKTPVEGAPVLAAAIPRSSVDRLRGVGGLTPSARSDRAGLAGLFTAPLLERTERVDGLWVRKVTLENP